MGSAIVSAPLLYIDTNVFIAALEGPEGTSDVAWQVLEAIERGDAVGVTSELTLAELLVQPMRRGDGELVSTYEAMIASDGVFTVAPVDRGALVTAARLRADHPSLRLPDAIHLATAIATGAGHLVTRDVRLAAASPIPVTDGGPQTIALIQEAQA